MNTDAVILTLKSILSDEPSLDLSLDQIDDNAPLMDGGLGLDSIGILEIIGLVEKTFNFQFQDEDLRISIFKSLRTLADAILERTDR